MVPVRLEGCCDHTPRDACALASHGLSHLLAVEIALTGRAAAGRNGVCTENLIRIDEVMESPKLAG